MKTNTRILMTTIALLGSSQAAHAASTHTTYSSGWLVLAFFGLCALVVTMQRIPALMMLAGALKGLMSSKERKAVRQLS